MERWLSYKGTCHVILLAKLHDMYLYKTDNFFHINHYLKSVSKVALLHRFHCMIQSEKMILHICLMEAQISLHLYAVSLCLLNCWIRAWENRKNSRSGPKLRILDRFQTPQNANKSVQQVCALNPIFPQPNNFHESMMSKKITSSQVFPN